ncbi:MFS transporter [Pseudomaricurvus alcaniphilus]|uniref:MFS transporter n=1 Tax=Pseudomaricurvus alcaniphilus TaxID=1166482 RepID=UPI00140C99B8|nr:MFS transporter [Pseudomaricurvus alcaniphilus]NHN36653.1 MFS transporter [Pseudomaricurvus alcaniphilus]
MNYSVLIPYLAARVFISLVGSMLSVIIGWHLYQLTGDPFDLALVGLVQIIPVLGLFIVTGWVVDHFPRRQVLFACALAETLVLIGLALVMQRIQQAQPGEVDKQGIFFLLFLHGSARAFYGPAQQAILPNIVSRQALARAVALTATVWNVASTSGPFIAGLLLAWFDYGSYWIMAGLGGMGTLLFFAIPKLPHVKPLQKGWGQVLGGIRFIRGNPIILGSISLDLFAVLFGSVMALLPVYAIDILQVGPEALGFLRGMPALGAVMMGIALTRLPAFNQAGKSLFLTLTIFALSIILFAFSSNYWLSLLALWIYGASDMVSMNIRNTLLQLATPDALRGRVAAVNTIFIATSNKMGDFRAGAVAALLSPVATVALGGVMALGVAVGGYYLFAGIRSLKRLDDVDIAEQ